MFDGMLGPGIHQVEMGIAIETPSWWKRRVLKRRTVYHWALTVVGGPQFKGVAPTEYDAFQHLIDLMVSLGLPDQMIQVTIQQQEAALVRPDGADAWMSPR